MKKEQYVYSQTNKREKQIIDVECYTVFGEHDYIDEEKRPKVSETSQKIYAKTITSNNRTRYFVKVGTYGKIFNPIGMYSEGKENKFLSKIGKAEWRFKEVNSSIFNFYLNFLSTRNIAWLNNAQRELT